MNRKPVLKAARNTIIVQLVLLMLVGIGTVVIRADVWQAAAVVLGGLSALVPYMYVLWRVVKTVEQSARQFFKAFMQAELVKIGLAIVLLALCFQIADIPAFALLLGFATVIVAQWAFPILLRKELSGDGGAVTSGQNG